MAFHVAGKTILNESFSNDVVNAVWNNLASLKLDPAEVSASVIECYYKISWFFTTRQND
jgi:hypothetical protein